MDGDRFDSLARALSTTGSRRGALGALVAATLGVIGGIESAAARKRKRRQRERRRQNQRNRADAKRKSTREKHRDKTSAQGPCGNGSGKANACKRDGQCCTGYCDQKNERCRCKKLNESCSEDRNCCAALGQPMTCQNQTCQRVTSPPPPPATTACHPEPVTQTCAGRCQIVSNNCGNPIDCGPCRCGSCPVCQTCDTSTGFCVAVGNGTPCDDGNACTQTDTCQGGTCVGADPVVCPGGQRCVGGTCVCDGVSCATGCCDGAGVCRIDDDSACGFAGGGCTPCSGTGVTCGGAGTAGVCGCTPDAPETTCAGMCGMVPNNCGNLIDCTALCAGCCDGATCNAGDSVSACGSNGDTCDICDANQPCNEACTESCGGVFTATTGTWTIEDDVNGIVEIVVLQSDNADTVVPPFIPGTTDPVTVIATKNPSQVATVAFRVTDGVGTVRYCGRVF